MESTFFDPKNIQSGTDIQDTIQQIKQDMSKFQGDRDYESKLRDKWQEFAERYPTLFEKLINGNLNETTLQYMLTMLDNLKEGTKTEVEASTEVGKKLYSEYVANKVNTDKEGVEQQPSNSGK